MNRRHGGRGALWIAGGASALLMTMLAVAALGACTGAPQATPTPTKTPIVEPTATWTPMPTMTPAPTETPTATPTATAEVIAGGELPPREPGVSIFTGLRPQDPSVLDRRPLAIKVDNDLAVVPQSGLSKADVVIESSKEGCMTRMTAIYQSQDAARVGSIRSVRIIDKELPVIFDAILAFSGGVEPVRQMIYQSDLGDHVLEQARNGAAFFRDPNIAVPFNLFANTSTLWQTATARGWNTPPEPSAAWVFSALPAGGADASKLEMPYPKAYARLRVSWSYDPASGRWLRFIGGTPHVDKVDGRQLSAANVVVLFATHVQTLIPEQGTVLSQGACSNASVEIQLWGQGRAVILRDGKACEGRWVRPDRDAPFRFLDADGEHIPLKPGNSWWQIAPLDMAVEITG